MTNVYCTPGIARERMNDIDLGETGALIIGINQYGRVRVSIDNGMNGMTYLP